MKKFAAKLYFITKATGAGPRKGPPKSMVLLEERIILIFAKDFAEAKVKALRDVRQYCLEAHKNIYGQTVRREYAGVYDIYELYDEKFKTGAELFSATHLMPKKPTRKELILLKLGPSFGKKERLMRLKFLNEAFNLKHKQNFLKSLARKKK